MVFVKRLVFKSPIGLPEGDANKSELTTPACASANFESPGEAIVGEAVVLTIIDALPTFETAAPANPPLRFLWLRSSLVRKVRGPFLVMLKFSMVKKLTRSCFASYEKGWIF